LLTLALIGASLAVLTALATFLVARRAGRRADRLIESYWDLRYEVGQLKVRVSRLESAAGLGDAPPDQAAAARSAPTTSFVPLSSLKK
jgi:hypothetical protein